MENRCPLLSLKKSGGGDQGGPRNMGDEPGGVNRGPPSLFIRRFGSDNERSRCN
jgi:hypothetical protein